MQAIGERTWVVPDCYLPATSSGDLVSHEAACVLNTGDQDARIAITAYFEDREPITGFRAVAGARRTLHIRLDHLVSPAGERIPVGVPYAILLASDVPITVQASRLDTTQTALTLMTTIAYPVRG